MVRITLTVRLFKLTLILQLWQGKCWWNLTGKLRKIDIHATKIIKSLLGRARTVKWLRNFFAIFQENHAILSEKFYLRDE